MKILQISSAFPKSGRGGIDADMANALAGAGHDVCVAALDANALPDECELRRVGAIKMMRVKIGSSYEASFLPFC